MKKRKIVFIIILSIIVVMISGIIFICIWQNKNGNSVVISDKAYDMYIEINPIIKLSFKEQYKKCNDKSKNNKCEMTTVIEDYKLINDDAKSIYKDIDFNDKEILDVLPQMVDKVYENNINFTTIKITTNWEDGYNEEDLNNSIKNNSKYHKTYNLLLTKTENINEEKIENQEIISKTFEKINILGINSTDLKNKEFYPNLATLNQRYTVKIYGTKDTMDNIDVSTMDICVDFNDFNWITTEKDDTGKHFAKLYLNTDKDIYYTVEPNEVEINISYQPRVNMNDITNEEIKEILNKYASSIVKIVNNDDAVHCYSVNPTYCEFVAEPTPDENLFRLYERFGFGHDLKGFPTGTGSSWCTPDKDLSTCLTQFVFELK